MSDQPAKKAKHSESTDVILNDLISAKDFDSFSREYEDAFISAALSEYIDMLIKRSALSKSDVIKRSNLDRVYGYQIISGVRKPTREKLLQLGFGLGLDADGMQSLLKTAGMAPLYAKIKREAAILFCLNKMYDLIDTQIFLQEENLKLIGE